MADEKSPTTQDLVNGAVAELAAVGQADFTMEGCARRAFYSIGALYERWPDRNHLLAEIANSHISPTIRASLAAASDRTRVIDWALDDGCDVLLLAGEFMIAGHNNVALREEAHVIWDSFYGGMQRLLPPGMAWYVSTYAIGSALLRAIGLPGPLPPRGRTTWLVDACVQEQQATQRTYTTNVGDIVSIPTVPEPSRSDPVALALIDAARLLLEERGAAGVSTREIAAGAGVTTGAMYRRYGSKAQLLSDVLVTQLNPSRYEWTWQLIQGLSSDDPYGNAADVLTSRMLEVSRNAPLQKVLLQVGVAARNDENLRRQVQDRIIAAHHVRANMFEHFQEIGLVRDDVDPAVLAWGFQAIPVGVRVLLPLGVDLDEQHLAASMKSIMSAAAGDL